MRIMGMTRKQDTIATKRTNHSQFCEGGSTRPPSCILWAIRPPSASSSALAFSAPSFSVPER